MSFIDQDHETNRVADGGLVREWVVLGDTDGDDIGKSYVEVNFNPVRARIIQTGDCVSGSALRAMSEEKQLSPVLETQIMKLQPRLMLMDTTKINQ